MAIDSIRQMTVEEYFAYDEAIEYKSEYIDGEVIPMTGGTLNHSAIMLNASSELRQRLKGSDCRVLTSSMRIRVGPTRYLYPDFSVFCGAPETDERSINLFNPLLVAEVTSPASIDYDRGAKLHFYQSIPSLRIYLVIDQQQPLVELYERHDAAWQSREYANLDTIVPLLALNCHLPLAEIYAGISF